MLFSCLTIICCAQSAKDTTVSLFFEKAYLHTDRDMYAQGDDIWFKAYLVNAQTNQPIAYSRNLYVELINASAKIITRRILRLDKGIADGDFKLNDTIAPGTYRIRAYTNWMRNFGDNFIYEKNISIVELPIGVSNPTVKGTNGKKSAGTPPPLLIAIDAQPHVDFFPEGGSLVDGVLSNIAVKSVNASGMGIPASGDIVNKQGIVIKHFTCDSLGFGGFLFKADATQPCRARVNMLGQMREFPLPVIQATGFTLMAGYGKDFIGMKISCNDATYKKEAGTNLYITAKSKGKTYFRHIVSVADKSISANIPYSALPDGVIIITISDVARNPLCERLIYKEEHPHLALAAGTDKTEYQPKEKVTVKLKLDRPGKASLSLAAVDASSVQVNNENILSYLNLQSEVRGRIEQPGRYFSTDNTVNYKEMELLLLTQGWRNFVWKRLEDTTLAFNHELEQGLTITGRVRKVGSDKPVAGINVTMRAPKADGQKLFWASTDADGRFTIDNPVFYGYQMINFTARHSTGIKSDGSSKESRNGWIQVDSLVRDTLPVKALTLVRDTSRAGDIRSVTAIDKFKRATRIPESHQLKEVVIKGNNSRLVTRVPPEIHNITLAEQKEYSNLAQFLLSLIERSGLAYGNCRYCSPEAIPGTRNLILTGFPPKNINVKGVYADNSKIDYCNVCQEDYLALPMNNVLKVTINRSYDVFWLSVSVNVILRPGCLKNEDYFDNTAADMTGYYKARIFYSPKFESKDEKPDMRTHTIHWEPNIVTDKNGEAVVFFNNTDQKNKVVVLVQGITDSGTPLVASVGYEVK